MFQFARISSILTLLVYFGLGWVAPAALAEPPAPPSGMFIKADKTTTEAQVHVTWKDFSDEDQYELIRTESWPHAC